MDGIRARSLWREEAHWILLVGVSLLAMRLVQILKLAERC
jgi:hypothetical protein